MSLILSDEVPLASLWKKFAGEDKAYLNYRVHQEVGKSDLLVQISEIQIEIQSIQKKFQLEFQNLSWIKLFAKAPGNNPTEWTESRHCLLKVLQELSSSKEPPFVSLSHTDSRSIAISLQPTHDNILGVGVDIEKSDRSVSSGASEKFALESEKNLGLTALEIWVIKESCFKASSKMEGTFVTRYEIEDYDSFRREGHAKLITDPNISIRFMIREVEGYLISFAISSIGAYAEPAK